MEMRVERPVPRWSMRPTVNPASQAALIQPPASVGRGDCERKRAEKASAAEGGTGEQHK